MKKYLRVHRYNIKDIIKDEKRNMLLLDQIRMSVGTSETKKRQTQRGYEYECLNCGNIDIIGEYSIDKGHGCSVCSGHKVVRGINDIATIKPELMKYFVDIEDTYRYTYLSAKKVLMKCPCCGFTKETIISTLSSQGFSCKKCGDGISYSQKFLFELFSQLNIKFSIEESFNWSNDKRYDFYLIDFNVIVESNGIQHYRESNRGRTLKEEQENDKLKEQLAKDNEIKIYIKLDCRESDMEFVKRSILSSELNFMFDLSTIDWLKCHEYACSSLVKVVCDLWNSGIRSTSEIRTKVKLANSTVILYLKQGTTLNWVNYNGDVSRRNPRINCRKEKGSSARKIICLNTKMAFDCIDYAIEYYGKQGINLRHIGECCSNKRKSCGKLPNGEKLKWMYYEDYIQSINN